MWRSVNEEEKVPQICSNPWIIWSGIAFDFKKQITVVVTLGTMFNFTSKPVLWVSRALLGIVQFDFSCPDKRDINTTLNRVFV